MTQLTLGGVPTTPPSKTPLPPILWNSALDMCYQDFLDRVLLILDAISIISKSLISGLFAVIARTVCVTENFFRQINSLVITYATMLQNFSKCEDKAKN